MKTYKYQLHSHTYPCSHCSKMSPQELAKGLCDGGYDGCVITNHFFNGNTGIEGDVSWQDFVKEYEQDYLLCKESAAAYGIDVFFGVEEHVGDGLEVLFYGIEPELLYAHPELSHGRCEDWYGVVHGFGGLCIQAHPFRDRKSIKNPRILPLEFIDGIEVYNAGNTVEDNEKAAAAAKELQGLILINGADAHRPDSMCVAGIETAERITSQKQLVEILKSGNYNLID